MEYHSTLAEPLRGAAHDASSTQSRTNKLGSRYGVALALLGTALVGFMLLRLVLALQAREVLDLTPAVALKVVSVGLLYDLGFLAYMGLAVATFALLPNRLFAARPIRAVIVIGLFATLCAFFFELVSEWYFWEEFSSRFNFIAVAYLIYRREVTDNIKESYPLLVILPAIAAASLALLYTGRRWIWRELGQPLPTGRRFRFFVATLVVAGSFNVLLRSEPRNNFHNNYAQELASNGPFQFVSAFKANELDFQRFYALGDPKELTAVLRDEAVLGGESLTSPTELFSIAREVSNGSASAGPNVVLVCVESLSSSFMARFGNEERLTPFLDSLTEDSLFFTRCYATGTRTTRGLEALTLSLPPTPGRSIVKRPDCDRYASLGQVLGNAGYDRAFLYGGRGYFDNMNAFFTGNGYRVVDQTDIDASDTTFENAWGVCDEDLYRRTIREADRCMSTGKPFFLHVMTTSNHRPYTYPEGRVPIAPGTNRQGAVQYTDHALSVFFDEARARPWFNETIFVIVADHCASSAGRVGLPVHKYHIPLLIYAPTQIAAREVDKICSQVDVAPTLLSLLGISYTSRFFGEDVMQPDFRERAFIGNYQKLGLLDRDGLAILSPQQVIEVMDSPFGEQTIRRAIPQEPLVQRTQAAYQAADHVIRTRMNRW